MKRIKLVYRNAEEIYPQESNPRINEPAVEKVRASIRRFGFRVPLVTDKAGNIWAGETRYKSGLLEGLTEFPCTPAEDLTEEELRAYRIADNKVAEFSDWDEDKLQQELASINIDMTEFGIAIAVADEIAAAIEAEEKAFNYEEQYGVIVMCDDEAAQEKTYNALKEQGYNCKVVAV